MLKIFRHTKFKTDTKKLIRSGRFSKEDEEELFKIIEQIAQSKPLPHKYRDHPLTGNWKHHRECHVKPDLLLIYKVEGSLLKLIRIGSHSQLAL